MWMYKVPQRLPWSVEWDIDRTHGQRHMQVDVSYIHNYK